MRIDEGKMRVPEIMDGAGEDGCVAPDSGRMHFPVDNHQLGMREIDLWCALGIASFAFIRNGGIDPAANARPAHGVDL